MITQITPQVSIGDSNDARRADNNTFGAILNVAIDFDWRDGFKYRHKVGLFDGPGNDPLTFFAAVLLLESLVRSKKRVLVHCGAGMSRSVMVVAAWMSLNGTSDLDTNLHNVMAARKVTTYRTELYVLAGDAIRLLKKL
jgi:protein-tyrosine phosphatase